MALCSFCGVQSDPHAVAADGAAPADDADVPLTWITSFENGKSRVYCDRCSRDNLRAIESKLDAEWW